MRRLLAALALMAAGLVTGLVQAQTPVRVYRVGVLLSTPLESHPYLRALSDELRRLGWEEGRNLRVDMRSALPGSPQLRALAGELVALQPDVLVSFSSPPTGTLKEIGTRLPVVFGMVGDPVGLGVVKSLAQPGGNFTGVSNYAPDLAAKRLQFLLDLAPSTKRIAHLTDPNNQSVVRSFREAQAAAEGRGLMLFSVSATTAEEVRQLLAAVLAEKADALMIGQSNIGFVLRHEIAEFAKQHRLPAVYGLPDDVRAGGLLSYGIDPEANYRQTAGYVDKVLRGARPADLPVAQPAKFHLAVNLKAAAAIGVTVPLTILELADEVLE